MSDALWDGRCFRTFNVVDDFNREVMAVEIDLNLPAPRVIRVLELIAHRYEAGSLLITSNQPFSAWHSIFPDDMMAVAAIDRLVHHADIVELTGESYRKRAHARINKPPRLTHKPFSP